MTSLESRIKENIWRFDPLNLLVLLFYHGYGLDEILFCSHFNNSSQARLVETIDFRTSPKKAIITLNMGLLGGQSTLPNYLFKHIDDQEVDTVLFSEFFGYFDDRLLRRFLLAIYPELNHAVFPDWESYKRSSLYTLKLDSINALHWLMQLIFPELQVRVEKATLMRQVTLNAPILGKCHLGHQTVFGKRKQLPIPGKRITLISDDSDFAKGQPWPLEINRRLESLVFPILKNVGLFLDVWLTIRNQGTELRLTKNSYLGYENIRGNTLQLRRIRIFSGYLCD